MHVILDALWFNRQFNDKFTIMFFWLPLFFNAVAYVIRIHTRIQADKKMAAVPAGEMNRHHYTSHDWLRVGHIIGYIAVTVLPLVNLIFFICDTLGDIWRIVWERFSKFFNFRFIGRDAD